MMQAIVHYNYGSPAVLQLAEVPRPVPQDDQVLVKVHSASANPLDWHLMRGAPFVARLGEGLFKPRNKFLGADVAGRVEAVGKNVTEFQPGDAVFGDTSNSGLGSFAEYVAVRQSALALKPANLSFEAAAAVPVAAYTALQGLRAGGLRAGQSVLINGASGGIGTFAVQIAKAFDTEVTGVTSTRNLGLVTSIGADHVVDYTQTDFTRTGQRYDLIFDTIGNRSVADLRRSLSPAGVCIVAGFTSLPLLIEKFTLGAWVSRSGPQKVGMMETSRSDKADLLTLKSMLEAGQIVPVIDRCYPLSETPQAIGYLETMRARGKVIIVVEPAQRPSLN